jgi:hypothetical protein
MTTEKIRTGSGVVVDPTSPVGLINNLSHKSPSQRCLLPRMHAFWVAVAGQFVTKFGPHRYKS